MSKQKKHNITFTIAKRELHSYFTSPIAYIVTALFLIATGIFFYSTFFLNKKAELRIFFTLLPYSFCLFIPAITMRVFSEEQKSGSIDDIACDRNTSSSRKISCKFYFKQHNAHSDFILHNYAFVFWEA